MRAQALHRRILVAGATILSLLITAACGQGADSDGSGSGNSYRITVISDISGAFSSVSAPGASSIEMAVNNINATGGVNGKKIDLQVIDSQSSGSLALTAAQKAIAANPLALVMFSGSAGAASITSLAQSARVPLLSPALSDTSLYPAQPYLFQTSLTAKQDAEALYRFVEQRENGSMSGKTVDVAAINSPYVDVIIKQARTLLERAGARVAGIQRYDVPLASFATQAGAIARDNPNVVLTLGSTDDTVVVSKSLTAAGVTALQLGIPSGAAQATLQQIASPKYFALAANPYATTLPEFLAVADKYHKTADVSSSMFAMSGWVTGYVLAKSLEKCGTGCTSAALNTALEQVSDFTVPDGASYGPVRLSATNHVAAGTVRFHNYDPATGRFSESDPITVP